MNAAARCRFIGPRDRGKSGPKASPQSLPPTRSVSPSPGFPRRLLLLAQCSPSIVHLQPLSRLYLCPTVVVGHFTPTPYPTSSHAAVHSPCVSCSCRLMPTVPYLYSIASGYPFERSSALPSNISPPHTPYVSSPLSPSSPTGPWSGPTPPTRTHAFPTSRPLRPFPQLALPMRRNAASAPQKSPPREVTIQAPQGFRSSFVLNLTQAEFSRQD
jgi:hypothetical protein